MKILLTGAQGFTGKHFKNIALKCNHEIVELESDITNIDLLKAELSEASFDAVVHLAAISFVGHQDLNAFYGVNLIGTTNLLDVLSTLDTLPKAVLIASSANIYGNCDASPIDENQVASPQNHYATSKYAMEMMARTYLDRLPIFFVRPFNYTGVGQDESFIIPKLVSHFKRKAKVVELGNINVEREFNDVRFICDAYLKLLDKFNIGDVYNVCTNKPMPLSDVISKLSSLTNHHIEIMVNPLFLRSNEIHRLSGKDKKLINLLGDVNQYSIDETLLWMLSEN